MLDTLQKMEVMEVMEALLEKIRPPEKIRPQLDIGYRIENQSVIVFEIRPHWKDPRKIIEHEVAKTTFVKSRDHWKVYWMRASGWYPYVPPYLDSLSDFTKLLETDPHHCFWG